MKRTLFILPFLLLVACGDSPATTDAPPLANAGTVFGAAPEGVEIPDLSAMSDEEREAYSEEMMAIQMGIGSAVRSAPRWEQADASVRDVLSQRERVPAYMVEQLAAQSMLSGRLLDAPDSPDVRDAIGYYTDMMLRHETANAPLVERALDRLRGTWPPQRIEEAAASTVDEAREYAARRLDCEECARDMAAMDARLAESADRAIAQAVLGASRLESRFLSD